MYKRAQTLLAVFCGLVVGGLIILSIGENPFEVYRIMFRGGFGSFYYLSTTLTRATPIIFGGLAICLSWSSGYNSIGVEGQMVLSALTASILAVSVPGPAIVKMLAAVAAGVVVGAGYSAIVGWLNVRFQVILIISSLMMNYIANFLVSYFTTYHFKDALAADSSAVQTQLIAENVQFPRTGGDFSVNLGLAIALVAAVGLWVLMKRTRFGYQARMGGLNPRFARYGGVHSTRMLYCTLALSGAIAGLGGVCEVLGTRGRYVENMISSPGFAWTGIVAALMADFNPIGVLVSSVFLAGLSTGGSAVERSVGIPLEMSSLIQGIITLFMSVKLVVGYVRQRKAAPAGKKGEAL